MHSDAAIAAIGLTYTHLHRRTIIMKKLGLFAAGVLFGTAGIKLLGSKG